MKPLLAALLLLAPALAAAADVRDVVILRNDQRKLCFIETETADGKLRYRDTEKQAEPKAYRLSEVRSWEYFEMREGHWPRAVEARDAGRYAEAADLFNAVAGAGQKEWQKVYGAYHEGACWELLGEWTKAADSFARVLETAPEHRLALDARYRRGFALARAKQDTEAAAIADELTALFKDKRISEADPRANAIRAALAFNAGKADDLKRFGRLVVFSARDEKDAFLQFGAFFADALRQLGQARDAASEYQRLLDQPDFGASDKVALSLGQAKVLLETDKPAALMVLLRIDALPYGSPEQKTEARYLAGKLLAEDAKAAAAAAQDDDAKDFARSLERSARLLLGAAAESMAAVPAKDLAQAELEAMGPDPDAPPEPKAEDAPAAPAAAPAAPAAPAAGTAAPAAK